MPSFHVLWEPRTTCNSDRSKYNLPYSTNDNYGRLCENPTQIHPEIGSGIASVSLPWRLGTWGIWQSSDNRESEKKTCTICAEPSFCTYYSTCIELINASNKRKLLFGIPKTAKDSFFTSLQELVLDRATMGCTVYSWAQNSIPLTFSHWKP